MRAVILMNFKMTKWANVHKKSIPITKVQVGPAEMVQINKDADDIFAKLDINKVKIRFSTSRFIISENFQISGLLCQVGEVGRRMAGGSFFPFLENQKCGIGVGHPNHKPQLNERKKS